jgi:hypothetical protein
MHVTATLLEESAISGEDFRTTMRRLADGLCSISDGSPVSALGATGVGGLVRGRLPTGLGVTSLLADQLPATLREPATAGGTQQ